MLEEQCWYVKSGVSSLFWPKIHFSISQSPKIYQCQQSTLQINIQRFKPALSKVTTLFLDFTQALDITSQTLFQTHD